MTSSELIVLNLSEIRRRSILLWRALPESQFLWKPDPNAMSAGELIRHVLEADYGWNRIINGASMENYKTPWKNRPITNLEEELEFADPHRKTFLATIQQFSERQLGETTIIHPGNGESKNLATYLLRIGYHESVHAGQFMSYLRTMNIDRPNIWD